MLFKRLTGSAKVVLAASLLATTSLSAGAHNSSNPLRDYYSAERTSDFMDAYPGVDSMTVNVDIPYGPDERNTFDVYRPNGIEDAPIIVMVHGGNWNSGDKADADVAAAKAAYWVDRGYVFVSVNYRLGGDIDPLTQTSDLASAVARIQTMAADWGADGSKMVLMGHGAGGHLAALLSANPSTATDQGASPWKAAVILDAPAVDVPALMAGDHPADFDTAFGDDASYWNDASPKATLTSAGVPVLLVCSAENPVSSCSHAQSFRAQALSRGVDATVMVQALSPADVSARLGVDGDYTEQVDDFISGRL